MTDTAEKGKKKRDLILACGILAAAAILFLITRFLHQEPAAVAEVSVDGQTVASLDLHSDQEFTVESPDGGSNHLVIRDGEIWVTEATCPDKVCIHQGKISHDGEVIVCLPNRMIVQIRSGIR